MICKIFDDPDDTAWCFTKLLSDVMGKNAPSKTRLAFSTIYENESNAYKVYALKQIQKGSRGVGNL